MVCWGRNGWVGLVVTVSHIFVFVVFWMDLVVDLLGWALSQWWDIEGRSLAVSRRMSSEYKLRKLDTYSKIDESMARHASSAITCTLNQGVSGLHKSRLAGHSVARRHLMCNDAQTKWHVGQGSEFPCGTSRRIVIGRRQTKRMW